MAYKRTSGITPSGLRNRYIVALVVIALLMVGSQLVIQVFIERQQNDAHVINVAGRQRMLSQKITKTALYLRQETDPGAAELDRLVLSRSLETWTQAHKGLIGGDMKNDLPGDNSPEVARRFNDIQHHHDAMVVATRQVLAATRSPGYRPSDLDASLKQLEENETHFLLGMDNIVEQYDAEAGAKLAQVKIAELSLVLLALLTLTVEALLIFRPMVKALRRTLFDVERKEQELKKLFDIAPSVMLLLRHRDLSIMRLSRTASALIGIPITECIDRGLHEFLESRDLGVFVRLEMEGGGSAVSGLEVTFKSSHGEPFSMMMSVSAIEYRDEPAFLVGLADISEHKRNEELLSRLATTDGMTSLLNRRTGIEILKKEIERTKRGESTSIVAFLDLNGLKMVNDTFSHDEGDWMISAFARVISAAVRASDSAIRYGGDEFLIIFPDCTHDAAQLIMLRMEVLAAEAALNAAKSYEIDFSYGLAEFGPDDGRTAEQLIAQADASMYEMKRQGRIGSVLGVSESR